MKNANVFLVALMLTLSVLQNAYGFSGQGLGTEQDPYIITNIYQLQEMNNDLDAWYKLGNDIDASDTKNWNSGAGFVPVGAFTGTFDGQGHKITGLFINRTMGLGLFGSTGSGAIIKNVGLVDVNITGSDYVGGLVGFNHPGTIENSYATGSVSGDLRIGGLVGENWGAITNSYATGSVTSTGYHVGGLAGSNYGAITNSYATGRVTAYYIVGGLVGWNTGGAITNSYATGMVTGYYNDRVGGLVGQFDYGPITNSYWDINTSGKSTSAGGTGKTTAEMQTLSTFVSAGWDFGTPIWVYYTNGYPRLAWEPTLPTGDLNHDKVVNFLDFAILAEHWLEGD
jgi:hypothetical protein